MSHKVQIRSIRLPTGQQIDLMYWAESSSILVAGFIGEKKVTRDYIAEVDISDDFSATFYSSVIDKLAETIDSDLKNNPELHLRNITTFYCDNQIILSRPYMESDEKLDIDQRWVIGGITYIAHAISFDPANNIRKITVSLVA